ncbi:MAG TPA: DUF4294 domain-containing protein [Ferruginibacter sp.]|nr:DUF4294 domain-containing protein [Ferruginibacter sp.]
MTGFVNLQLYMLKRGIHIKVCTLLLVFIAAGSHTLYAQEPSPAATDTAAKEKKYYAMQYGANDTITSYAVIYKGDTMEAKTLYPVDLFAKYPAGKTSLYAQYNRLRNAVYVTYPYALKAGWVLNDINNKLEGITDKSERRKYIKSREKELKKEFTDPLSNLSIYQGRVLMKLINRETGNNCYEIIKEYKGGLTARFYQTVAFFFSSNLKQPYDAAGEDLQIERFVQEVCRSYGYNYVPGGPLKPM